MFYHQAVCKYGLIKPLNFTSIAAGEKAAAKAAMTTLIWDPQLRPPQPLIGKRQADVYFTRTYHDKPVVPIYYESERRLRPQTHGTVEINGSSVRTARRAWGWAGG